MQALALPGFHTWSQWQPDRGMFFSSFLWVREGGNVAFDPLPLTEDDAQAIEGLGGVSTILLTNRDHERGAAAMRERFGARIFSSRLEAELFELKVDGVFDRVALPGLRAIPLEGAKTPGEVAFLTDDLTVAIAGDAILGTPAGALSFLPDAKLGDPLALALSLRRLWTPRLRTLLLGDGASLYAGAEDALAALIEARGGPAVNRVNVDELEYEFTDGVDGKYASHDAEIGWHIGGRHLGYQMVRLPAGARFCPMHAHDREEELFYVIEGHPTVRTLRGDLRLRPGDFMAFPVGDRGTHQLANESDVDALVLLLGEDHEDETVYYPDSRKVLAGRRRWIMREDHLDYFDGE
ncbi:MAG TPA: cupin domain-containing protein [Candidatus Acidoferrales bacterium]|jgi:uncharacterized cupin superfamily protein|nr:cupin domain-containing protein [Candidatus Acidoferrales bacterium]